jgi:hypothetical protein
MQKWRAGKLCVCVCVCVWCSAGRASGTPDRCFFAWANRAISGAENPVVVASSDGSWADDQRDLRDRIGDDASDR